MSYTVDYKRLFPIGDIVRQNAKALNSSLLRAHQELEKMHETWDGKRWGEVAKLWNNMIPSFEDTCTFLVEAVPFVIEFNARNYASVDGGNVGEPFKAFHKPFPNNLQEGLQSIFLSDENATQEKKYKDALEQDFAEAISYLNKIEEAINSTKNTDMWEGPAAEKSRTKFAESKETILSNIKKMENAVLTHINEAIDDYKTQEQNADDNANAF